MNRKYKLLSVLLSCAAVCLTLLSCQESVRPNFNLEGIEGKTVFESDVDWTTYLFNQKYMLNNNVWNKGATTGKYRQKIFLNDESGKQVFGWTWQWNYSTGVVAYPEVMYGSSPWSTPTAQDTGFPFQAGTKKLTVNYNAALSASGTYNMAFEFWTVTGIPPVKDKIKNEVMIWISSSGLQPAGNPIGTCSVQDITYTVYAMKNHGDDSGVNKNVWSIITFKASKPVMNGPLDISLFIEYLLAKGIMSKDEYVACLELGDEVVSGIGNAEIRGYSISVE